LEKAKAGKPVWVSPVIIDTTPKLTLNHGTGCENCGLLLLCRGELTRIAKNPARPSITAHFTNRRILEERIRPPILWKMR